MMKQKQIITIALNKLIAHPGNCNRMNDSTFGKLFRHIERTGNYEPIIVRPHPKRKGSFEILNGHHRLRVLEKLGAACAECIVWKVDDAEALVLLATLNRLAGSDDVYKKSRLVAGLSRHFSSKDLVRMLAESRKSIERLKKLKRPIAAQKLAAKSFLNPMMFFLTDEQKIVVEKAIGQAVAGGIKGTAAQKRAAGLVKIAKAFI
jgi:ParB-like chromosome segregation protein Spo0J